jgi:hypothetical protein
VIATGDGSYNFFDLDHHDLAVRHRPPGRL